MTSKTLTDKHGDVITISDGGLTLAPRGHVVVHVKETTPGRVHTATAYADPAQLRAALDEVAPVQPTRPEGLVALIDTIREATYDPEPEATGEALYNAGVRVTGLTPTNPEPMEAP